LILFAILSDHNDKSGNLKAFEHAFQPAHANASAPAPATDPDADIFADVEQYSMHWSENKDLLQDKLAQFYANINDEAGKK
jgi:hypothetical protein